MFKTFVIDLNASCILFRNISGMNVSFAIIYVMVVHIRFRVTERNQMVHSIIGFPFCNFKA